MDPVTLSLLIAGGGSLVSGILNYTSASSAQKANEEAYNRESAKADAMNERNLAETKRINDYNMKEALENKGYNRIQASYQRGAQLLSENMNLLQAKTAPLMRR